MSPSFCRFKWITFITHVERNTWRPVFWIRKIQIRIIQIRIFLKMVRFGNNHCIVLCYIFGLSRYNNMCWDQACTIKDHMMTLVKNYWWNQAETDFSVIKCQMWSRVNFKALKIFSVSWLNLDFVMFSLLVKKKCVKNMVKLGWKRFTFSAESISLWALKASIFLIGELNMGLDRCQLRHQKNSPDGLWWQSTT